LLKDSTKSLYFEDAKKAALDAHATTFPYAGCDRKCLEKQLDNYRDKACSEGGNPTLRKVNGNDASKYEEPEDPCPN